MTGEPHRAAPSSTAPPSQSRPPLPTKAAETSRENPWPVRALAQRMTEYVARAPAAWVEGQLAQVTMRGGSQASFLTLRDPSGALVETRTGDDVRIDVASAAAGTWRAEVASTGGEAEYEVEFTGSAPSTGGGGTVAGPGTFHVDPPRGATVRIEVRRKSGSAAASSSSLASRNAPAASVCTSRRP